MKPYLLFPLLIIIAAPAKAEVNTLEQALVLAYQHDPGLEAQRAKLRATDEQVSQALSNYRPSIDATADAGRSQTNVAGGNPFGGSGNLSPRDAGINITQPIFQGGRTVGAVDAAKATLKAGQASLEDAEQQLLFDTAKAYLDVLQAQDLLEINRANEQDLREQLDITKDRLQIGELKRTDVSQAESRWKIAEIARLQAETDLANKRITFSRLVGEMPGTLARPALTLEQPKTLDDVITLAEKNNPAVIAASYTHEAATSDVTTAESSLMPEINLVGSATRAVDQNVTLPQRQDSLSLLAKLTIPLYRSGTDYSKIRAAKQTVTQRDMEFQNARNKAHEASITAWQTLLMARQAITGGKEALDATDQALYGVKEEAKVGTRTTLDILNAEQELLNARSSLVKANHDEAVAILQVKADIGTLTAQALHLPVDIYDPVLNYKKIRNKWVGTDITEK